MFLHFCCLFGRKSALISSSSSSGVNGISSNLQLSCQKIKIISGILFWLSFSKKSRFISNNENQDPAVCSCLSIKSREISDACSWRIHHCILHSRYACKNPMQFSYQLARGPKNDKVRDPCHGALDWRGGFLSLKLISTQVVNWQQTHSVHCCCWLKNVTNIPNSNLLIENACSIYHASTEETIWNVFCSSFYYQLNQQQLNNNTIMSLFIIDCPYE